MRSFPFSNITASKSRMYFALGTCLNLDAPRCERQAALGPVAAAVGRQSCRLSLSSGLSAASSRFSYGYALYFAEVTQKPCSLCMLSGGERCW